MNWLRNDLVVLALIFLVAVLVVFGSPLVAPTRAAEPTAPTPISDNCELDSTIGILEVYFCEGNYGSDYMVNSFGMMYPVD